LKNLVTHVGKEEFRSFSRDYWYLMRTYKPLLTRAVLWVLMMQIVALAEPYGLKYVVDRVQASSISSVGTLVGILAVLFCALSVGSFVQVFKNWRIFQAMFPITRDLPGKAAKKLFGLPLSFHERENGGELLGKVIKGVNRTEDVTGSLFFDIGSLMIQTIVTATVIGWYSHQALYVFLVVVMLFSLATYLFKQRMMPVRSRRHDEDGQADKLFGQAIGNVATVQAFAQEEYERGRISDIREGIYVRQLDEFKRYLRFDFFKNQLVSIGRVSVIGLCAWSALGGSMGMGTFVFVVSLTEKVFIGCYRMGNIFDRVQEATESVHRLVQVLEAEEHLVDPPNPVDASTLDGSAVFRGVTHVYGGKLPNDEAKATRPALSDVDLEIRPGEFIGIVGPSGGGKSTLVKLLHRIDDPTVGDVRLGGVDLKLLSRPAFRRRIGYVPQEVEIFDGTIAENIAYGKHDATPAQIENAARVANAHGFIMRLKDGYAQEVGNRGMKLSGGQKQRIGIARAVLLDPLIFIFDEATSHVDSISEDKIMRAIDAIRRGKTTIMIAHRLSTVQSADRIVVMEEGRVVQVGSHAALMANEGLYRRLVDLQRADEEAI